MTSRTTDKVLAIIVAAGSGKRMGGTVPKQLIEIGGKPILRWTLEKFQSSDAVQEIILVTSDEIFHKVSRIAKTGWGLSKVSRVIKGGAERHDSVWAALKTLDQNVEIVLIHDGVRPFVSESCIRASIEAARRTGAAVVGVPPKDTVKQISDMRITRTLDRKQLLLAQTPQTFTRHIIQEAYAAAFDAKLFSTDDAALVENLGYEIAVVPGEPENIKITTPEDLVIARAFLQEGL